MNKQDLKVLELKVTADTEGAKKGFNSLVSSTNNFFDSLKSRLGNIRTLQKKIESENQAIKKEEEKIDSKVKKAETERTRALERLNNVPKYQTYNTIDKVTTRIKEQNKALQGTLEAQNKIQKIFHQNPVDFYKNLMGKNILQKGVEVSFGSYLTNFAFKASKKIKAAYESFVNTNPVQFIPRFKIGEENKFKINFSNDVSQFMQRKGEVLKGKKYENIYGNKEEQEAQNKRVAGFLTNYIKPEHLPEFKNYQNTYNSTTKDIKELQNLSEKIVQYNDTEKKLAQTNETATKAREALAPRIAELQNQKTQLPEQIQGLKNDIVSIIDSGRLNAEVKELMKNEFDKPRLQSRLQEMHRDVIRPAQDYLYLKGLETPITSRSLADFEHEINSKIPEAEREGLKTFFNKVAGVVDARDQIKNIVTRTKATAKIISELDKVKNLPAINDLKPTTDLNTLATYQGHEKTTSNVYRNVNRILGHFGVNLPETYDKQAIQQAVDGLVTKYQLNDLEKQRIQDATANLDALYNRKTALSEVIKQSQEKIRDEEKKALQRQTEAERLKQKQDTTNQNLDRVLKGFNSNLIPINKTKEEFEKLQNSAKTNASEIDKTLTSLKLNPKAVEDFNSQWQRVDKELDRTDIKDNAQKLFEASKKQNDYVTKFGNEISRLNQEERDKLKLQEEEKRLSEERAKIIRETRSAIEANRNKPDSTLKLEEQRTQLENRISNLQRASSVFKLDSTGAEKFDSAKDFDEQWQKIRTRDKLFDNAEVEKEAKGLHSLLRTQQENLKNINQEIAQQPINLRTARLKELTKQTNDLSDAFNTINSNPLINNLKEGKTISPEAFEGLQITGLSNSVKNLLKEHVKDLGVNGVKVNDKATSETLKNAISIAQQGSSTFNQREVDNLQPQFNRLREIDNQLDSYMAVQKRGKTDTPLTSAAEKASYERDLQNEINSRNMQLYAMSHALKAIEAPIQQAVDISKGNIDEYVKFQSAMVNVAKLMPSLRDKDTLLVNDNFVDFRQKILDLTDTLPVSGVSLAQASEEASRLGVTNYNQIKKIIELGAKLGNALGMQPNDVTNQIVKIANAKGIDLNTEDSIKQIMDFADAINYLDEHTAASGREIINFTKKAVQTAEGVKMDTKDVSAFGATLVALGISADQANTTFKNFMTVLQTGPRNKQKGYEYFEKSGLKVSQVMKAFKENPTKTAVEFIKRLNKLRNAPAGQDAASIVRFAFGQQAAQGLMALVNNPETLEKNLFEAKQNSKGLIEKEFEAKQKNDPAIRFKQLQNRIQKLQIDTGEILMPVADKFIKNIKGLADALTPFVKDNSDFIQNTAYTSVGLLAAVKGAGFLVDTATIFNNLRNWKGVQNFGTKWADMMSRSKTLNKILGGLGTVLTLGVNNWWSKPIFGTSGLGGWTIGSALLGLPAAALGGWGIGRGIATWHGFDGKADSIDDWFFKNGIVYKSDKAQTKARGTVKDTKRRNTAQNSSVFLNRKYQDLVERLHKKGYNFEKGQLFQDKKALNYEIYNSSLPFLADYLDPSARYIKGGKMGLVSEVDDPELFGLIDQIKEIYAKTKSARAREGILKEGKGTFYNKFRDRQIEVAENRVELEQELSAHLGLAYKYSQEGNKLLQHYEEMKANEVKGTLKKTKDWQAKARQIAEENQDKNLTEEQWQNLYASVLDTKLKKPEEKKKEEVNKKSRLQELNSLDDFVINSIIGKDLKKERDQLNLERATELYKSILAMRDLRTTNPDLYNKEGGDKQYQKYTDWFVGLQTTIAKQQGLGTDPYSMNAVLQEITDKWLSNQKAIKESEGQVAKYQEAMKKAEEENGKSIDNTKQQLTDLTQNPWEVKLKANTADFDQAVTNSVNKAKAQLATIGNTGGGGDQPPEGYNKDK